MIDVARCHVCDTILPTACPTGCAHAPYDAPACCALEYMFRTESAELLSSSQQCTMYMLKACHGLIIQSSPHADARDVEISVERDGNFRATGLV